ncbi:MAG: chorismate synthase [Deltaproteobacteria bacterium RIFCSPLOWO2_02_FULL_53_8]|nr:MAG: chorismate synthase [Deltaproteobacteria bacterium RIFCSPLOWO2_02_FULL_53_8]
MLRYLTSGESHGRELTAIIDGLPSGLMLDAASVNHDLKRRQGGYGRGGRMKIESDCVEITAGVRWGKTTGGPLAFIIKNKDWSNWLDVMSVAPIDMVGDRREVTHPRPGHADLTGGLKYGHRDLRNILERSSARETATRVAVGAIAKRLLEAFGINVYSWVIEIGGVRWARPKKSGPRGLYEMAETSAVRCPDEDATEKMKGRIDKAKADGDSLGGVFEVVITGVPPGLGSHVQWDRKLDARFAFALMSIQAVKGVEVGVGFKAGALAGSKVHDEIFYGDGIKDASEDTLWWPQSPRFFRKTNNAGGIEGGMSNGEPIVMRAVMKPIPTLYKPLRSVDIVSKTPFKASVERSDVCAVPAAAVVAEAVAAYEIATAFLEKFGGDSIEELARNYKGYLEQVTGY